MPSTGGWPLWRVRCSVALTSGIVCRAAAGGGPLSTDATSVTISNRVGTVTALFTYDCIVRTRCPASNGPDLAAPVVTELLQCNSPTTSGASITIGGMNFFPANPSPTVWIHGTQCSGATWFAETGITCLAAAGTGPSTASTSVTIKGLVATATALFTYDGVRT